MSTAPKITLSQEELQLASGSGFILAKRLIIQKAVDLFSSAANDMQEMVAVTKPVLPKELFTSSPKISRGENYLQLPYVVLDYPRSYGSENIFAIRTMFWWGNFFSMSLHLSGSYKKSLEKKLANAFPLLREKDFYYCINDDQWTHHFEPTNYSSLNKFTDAELKEDIRKRYFLKLAVKFPLAQWNDMPQILEASFTDMLRITGG